MKTITIQMQTIDADQPSVTITHVPGFGYEPPYPPYTVIWQDATLPYPPMVVTLPVTGTYTANMHACQNNFLHIQTLYEAIQGQMNRVLEQLAQVNQELHTIREENTCILNAMTQLQENVRQQETPLVEMDQSLNTIQVQVQKIMDFVPQLFRTVWSKLKQLTSQDVHWVECIDLPLP